MNYVLCHFQSFTARTSWRRGICWPSFFWPASAWPRHIRLCCPTSTV